VIANRRPCLPLAALAAGVLGIAGCGGSSASKPSTGRSSTAAGPQPSTSPPIATASSGSGRTVHASAGGVDATLHGSTHTPKAEQVWPLYFTVIRAGHAVRASVRYEYLLGGRVVAHRDRYSFDGHFSDVFKWPAATVGYPLTFRAVVAAEGSTINLEYPVRVKR
jgi:hypothetical protein